MPKDHNDGSEQPANGSSSQATRKRKRLGLRARLEHFTWANFTCTQSSGAVATLLSQTPHQFRGLQTAGKVVYIIKLVLFLLFCTAMAMRFILHPVTAKRSLTKPPELYFFGSFWLSIATNILCMQRFGVPSTGNWLIVTIRVLFWMYAAVTLFYTSIIFVFLFSRGTVSPGKIHPAVFLMVYNAMLTGTVASTIAETQPPTQRLPIIVAGVAYQGLGWILCLLLLPLFLGSLFSNGLANPSMRPGLFMPVGSAAYTIVALIGCARALPAGYGYFATHPNAIEILQVCALWTGVFLWLFNFWLFAVALIANLPTMFPRITKQEGFKPRMHFTLSWYAFVFPNVGFALATTYIGEELGSDAIKWIASVMTVVLFGIWLFDLILHLKSIIRGDLMWPGKDEDA